MLLSNFADDANFAAQLFACGAPAAILGLLRTPATTPHKLLAPALTAVRNLARHDDVRLRTVLQAGAVQLISGVMALTPSLLFPRVQVSPSLHYNIREIWTGSDFEAKDITCIYSCTKSHRRAVAHSRALARILRRAIFFKRMYIFSQKSISSCNLSSMY